MAIKAVIFDLDGTITQPYFDFDAIREEIGLDRNSGPVLEAMEKMTPAERLNAQKILHYHERKALEESRLNDSAKETIFRLREMGILVGILTRNTKENAFSIARMHGLHFDAVVGREEGPVKPDAFGVLHLCKTFGVRPQETLVVGDYLFDLQCARSAGAIAVLLANHKKAEEFVENADYRIERNIEVIDIIESEKQRLVKGNSNVY
ncbi:MAG: HAD family hydrolase [Sedimentisphaerales bacterium]